MRRIAVWVVALGLVAGTAAPANATTKVIDRQTARGDYAVVVASGSVDNPNALFVKVKARPNQHVSVSWNDVCSKGYGAGSKDGSFSGVTPIKRRIKMPYTDPDSCSFAASGQLDNSGKIIVILLARV
jgi:hypothetical protein